MQHPKFVFPGSTSLVVGSFGSAAALSAESPVSLAAQCDLAEIRLDLCHAEALEKGSMLWKHLLPFPLLFTARRRSEGSPSDLDVEARKSLLRVGLPNAALVDIEVASIPEMTGLIAEMWDLEIPWIASFHDFERLPGRSELISGAAEAKAAGARAFKVAATLRTMDDLTALAHFQISDQGIPISTMGMGLLAPVSRLLCAQAGSVLNYGFIGEEATAPGQWSARQLRDGIRSLNPFK